MIGGDRGDVGIIRSNAGASILADEGGSAAQQCSVILGCSAYGQVLGGSALNPINQSDVSRLRQ